MSLNKNKKKQKQNFKQDDDDNIKRKKRLFNFRPYENRNLRADLDIKINGLNDKVTN